MSLRTATVALVFLGLIVAACTSSTPDLPTPSFCNGIDSTIGGCEENLPQFKATDCAGTGEEFGALLDERTRAILAGPTAVEDKARSVRLKHAMALLSILANQHLRELDIRRTCDAPEFLAAAESRFSAELRGSVGAALYDGNPPATYEEWLAEVRRSIAVIDTEE